MGKIIWDKMIEGKNEIGMNRTNGWIIHGGMRWQIKMTLGGFGVDRTSHGLRSFDI